MADNNAADAAAAADAPAADQDEMIVQFSDVTGVRADRARFYLESANWTLQLALASFYEQDDGNPIDDVINMRMEEEDEDEAAAAGAAGGASVASSSVRRAPTGSSAAASAASLPFTTSVAAGSGGPAKKDKKKNKYKSSASGARIATIHNMDHSSSEDDEEEQGQAFYTGTERSGQQILGPPRRRPPPNDFVSEIFRSAQESGAAEMVDPLAPPSEGGRPVASGSGRSFGGGGGYRLGQTENDHVRLVPPGGSTESVGGRPRRPTNIEPVVLKLWRQGFSINDGELRSYEEQANKDFLESIMKGEIPAELRQHGSGLMVHVDLEDHRHEDFKRSVAKVKPFAGRGHTLGSPAPEVTQTVPAAAAATAAVAGASGSADQAADQKAADEQLAVNASEPTTMIQVRLADGSRLSARFNHTHTVEDIRTYIATARTQYAAQNFALLTSYPSKELADGSATISGAGLLNAALMQRLK